MTVVAEPIPSQRRVLRVPDATVRGAVRYWHRNAAVFRRTWLLGLMAWFAEPVIYLVAMGLGLGRYLETVQGVDYIDFIAPGLLAVSAMFGAAFESTWNAFHKMERVRVYDAVTSAPLSIEDVALGEVLWSTTRAAAYGAAFALVAIPFGVFKSWWGILTLPALALVGLIFSIIGLSYTYIASRMDFLAYYWTGFLTPMFMFSGIFFPLDRLPGWVEVVAWFMPLHHGADMMRALMLDGDPLAAAGAAAWLLAASALLLWLPLNLLRRRLVR